MSGSHVTAVVLAPAPGQDEGDVEFVRVRGYESRAQLFVGPAADTAVAAEDTGLDGDGTDKTFHGKLVKLPVKPGSVVITEAAGGKKFTDPNKDGKLTSDEATAGSGTIDYKTGEFTLTWNTAPAVGNITADYTQEGCAEWLLRNYSVPAGRAAGAIQRGREIGEHRLNLESSTIDPMPSPPASVKGATVTSPPGLPE